MKKLAVLLAFSFVFSGCSLFSSNESPDSLTGVLSEQQPGDEYVGTHLLKTEDGEFYELNSTILNLSSQQYLGNEVNLKGATNDETGIFNVDGVSVLKILEKEGGKVSWITHLDQELGFKFKYYDDWAVARPGEYMIEFTAPLQGSYENDEDKPMHGDSVTVSLSDWSNEDIDAYFSTDLYEAPVEAKIGANQQSAKKYEKKNSEEVCFIVHRNSVDVDTDLDVYFISFVPYEGMDDATKRTFYEMILEFQFVPFAEDSGVLDPTNISVEMKEDVEVEVEVDVDVDAEAEVETPEEVPSSTTDAFDYSSFSEFESLPYHFIAKYPAGWYYSGSSGAEDGILHKYSFSDESVTDENEFASLKVLSGDLPTGSSITLPNGSGVKKYVGGEVVLYVKVDDRVYSVQGAKDMEDTLILIAGGITSVTGE